MRQIQVIIALLILAACIPSHSPDPPNTVHLSLSEKVLGLDPIRINDDYSRAMASLAYEGLLQYRYLGDSPALEPLLAAALPEISADGRIYIFHLKPGVRFQDDPCFHGKVRELVADDFVYSLRRLADPHSVSAVWPFFEGRIRGLDEWRASGKSDYSAPIEGLRALDAHTLRIELKAPSLAFPYLLASPAAFVVPREAAETYGDELMRHPVGTGPYRLNPASRPDRFVWDRDPAYRPEAYPAEGSAEDRAEGRLEDAGKPLPRNDRVVAEVIVEDHPRWLSFLAGKLDLALPPKDGIQQAIGPGGELAPALQAKGIRLRTVPSNGVKIIGFNMADPVVGRHKGLRQALSLAFDSEKFIELFYGGYGFRAQGPIPPGLPGYDPAFRNPYRRHDLARARRLLAEAGFPGGRGLPPLEFATRTGGFGRQLGEFVQKEFGELGIEVKVVPYEFPQLVKRLHARQVQLWFMGEDAEYPDAEAMLRYLYGKNAAPGPNHSSYANPEFDRLYEQALGPMESAPRIRLYRRMQGLVAEDCPWIYVAGFENFNLEQRWVRNAKARNFLPSTAKYLRIDSALRP